MAECLYYLDLFENLLWGYIGAPIIMLLGLYLSISTNFIQLRKFPTVLKTFFGFFKLKEHECEGLHPLKAFCVSLSGSVGVGNIVATCTAVQLGGPGALFWIWTTAIAGMIIKYAEVFLGLRYRQSNGRGGYNGGPIYFLQHAFSSRAVPALAAVLLCIYGVEVYQFRVITEAISVNLSINELLLAGILLALVLFAASGGIQRVSTISTAIIPFFVLVYVSMGLWILLNNISAIPTLLKDVVIAAFSGQALVGGVVGGALMKTISEGARRSCYSGDIGVGYASIVHSESSVKEPEKQASLAIIDIFVDAFMVCTTSIMLILITGVWKEPISTAVLVQAALSQYFPYMHIFMPLFLFLVGYSTINAYFCVGLKCAQWLSPNYGKMCYYVYAIGSFVLFSFLDPISAQSVISIAACCLLVLNSYAIIKLRNEISYSFGGAQALEVETRTAEPNEENGLVVASL